MNRTTRFKSNDGPGRRPPAKGGIDVIWTPAVIAVSLLLAGVAVATEGGGRWMAEMTAAMQ